MAIYETSGDWSLQTLLSGGLTVMNSTHKRMKNW